MLRVLFVSTEVLQAQWKSLTISELFFVPQTDGQRSLQEAVYNLDPNIPDTLDSKLFKEINDD